MESSFPQTYFLATESNVNPPHFKFLLHDICLKVLLSNLYVSTTFLSSVFDSFLVTSPKLRLNFSQSSLKHVCLNLHEYNIPQINLRPLKSPSPPFYKSVGLYSYRVLFRQGSFKIYLT